VLGAELRATRQHEVAAREHAAWWRDAAAEAARCLEDQAGLLVERDVLIDRLAVRRRDVEVLASEAAGLRAELAAMREALTVAARVTGDVLSKNGLPPAPPLTQSTYLDMARGGGGVGSPSGQSYLRRGPVQFPQDASVEELSRTRYERQPPLQPQHQQHFQHVDPSSSLRRTGFEGSRSGVSVSLAMPR
jgi:hypothetical protein